LAVFVAAQIALHYCNHGVDTLDELDMLMRKLKHECSLLALGIRLFPLDVDDSDQRLLDVLEALFWSHWFSASRSALAKVAVLLALSATRRC
jgi:hypothetical protein